MDSDFCIRGTPLRVRERDGHLERGGVATAGQSVRTDNDRHANKDKENDEKGKRDSQAETEEWGGEHLGYRVQATLTVFSHTNIGVGITGGTVDTMVTEADTRLVEFTF